MMMNFEYHETNLIGINRQLPPPPHPPLLLLDKIDKRIDSWLYKHVYIITKRYTFS
jgi:hypothetical protein